MNQEQEPKIIETVPVAPAGITEENEAATKRVVRKFDSDDVMRLRSHRVIIDAANNVTDIGGMQKTFVCCGFKQLPWFSDIISERRGVTEDIFEKRWNEEFRNIPHELVDQLYSEVAAMNRFKVSPEEHQKK